MKRFTFVFAFFSLIFNMSVAQNFSKILFDQHENFKEQSLKIRRFKHQDIVPLISQLADNQLFKVEKAGKSLEERDIYKIQLGKGKTVVMLWSQMHGDEPTATMALFDIFNFMKKSGDEFDALRKTILENCTLHFIPMLNPDGAERYQRRTASEIDMNRDALRTQTPEGELLKNLQQSLKPEFGFNLHDQGTRYSAGMSNKQATISFLATAYDFPRSWNEVRTRSMQTICSMNHTLQQFIPGYIAKYSDEYEPRAFGDNIQKWGTSLILIESGGYHDDREKQFIRKLNFVGILTVLQAISEKSYTKYSLKDYEAIPNNEKYLFDLLIRNATFEQNGKKIIKDIGIDLIESNTKNATNFELNSTIEDMGDLSIFWGIKELDASGMKVRMLKDLPELTQNLKISTKEIQNDALNLNDKASFALEKDGKIVYLIVNGILQKIE